MLGVVHAVSMTHQSPTIDKRLSRQAVLVHYVGGEQLSNADDGSQTPHGY